VFCVFNIHFNSTNTFFLFVFFLFFYSFFQEGKHLITIFDLGGNTRKLWLRYYHKVHGIIWVVDASDPRSLNESKVALTEALLDERLSGKPILVYANKQDLPGALDEVEIAKGLGLGELTSSSHSVVKCTALPEKNGGIIDPKLKEGITWLRNKGSTKDIKIRVVTDTKEYEKALAIEKIETEERVKISKEKRRLAKEAKEAGGDVEKINADGSKDNVWSSEAPKPPSAPAVLKCAVVHPIKIWNFTTETQDEKGLGLCRKFNEDFSGTVAYQCSQAATCKCSKYKWKPVCEECDKWVRDGFPTLGPNGPIAVAVEEVKEAEEKAVVAVVAVEEEKPIEVAVTKATEVVAQNDENENTNSANANPLNEDTSVKVELAAI